MAGFRVRRGEREITVPDTDTAARMVRTGRLRLSDEAWVDGRWLPLGEVDGIVPKKTAAADPWAAWSDADDVDAEAVVSTVRAPSHDAEDIPEASLTPMAPAIDASLAVKDLPESAVAPVVALRVEESVVDEPTPVGARVPVAPPARGPELFAPTMSTLPPPVPGSPPSAPRATPPAPVPVTVAPTVFPTREPPAAIPFRPAPRAAEEEEPAGEPSGEVIHFPRTRVKVPELEPAPVAPPAPLIRPARVAMLAAIGIIVLVGAWTWVRMEVGAARALPSTPPAPVTEATPSAENHPGSGHQVRGEGELATIEKGLRSVDLGEPKAVEKDGDLGDAVLIDLQHYRLDITKVEAPVTRWGGKHRDEPMSAEVRIEYRSAGELDRELGAIALTVGRYKARYRLDLPVFQVTATAEDGPQRYLIDPTRAEQFARGRLSLEQLLAS